MYHPNIRKLRREKGYTLQKLADVSGVSKPYIWELEHRDKQPAAIILMKLAAALDTTITELMSSEDAPRIQHEPPEIGTSLRIITTEKAFTGTYLGTTKIAEKQFLVFPNEKQYFYLNPEYIVAILSPSY